MDYCVGVDWIQSGSPSNSSFDDGLDSYYDPSYNYPFLVVNNDGHCTFESHHPCH